MNVFWINRGQGVSWDIIRLLRHLHTVELFGYQGVVREGTEGFLGLMSFDSSGYDEEGEEVPVEKQNPWRCLCCSHAMLDLAEVRTHIKTERHWTRRTYFEDQSGLHAVSLGKT